jgi:SAM-dependent methyltransferase
MRHNEGVIETTVPEINVSELMELVRAKTSELARPEPKVPARRAFRSENAVSLPPVARLPAAPAVWVPGPAKSQKERLDALVQTAREKNEPPSKIPKFLRRFFRKQGGYNRAVVESIAALSKTTEGLTRRLAETTVCLGQFNTWLQALHEQSDADANWMKAAAPAVSKIGDLTAALETLDAEKCSVFEAQRLIERTGRLERDFQEVRQRGATTLERTDSLRAELNKVSLHLRNLQTQTDAIGIEASAMKEDWRNASARDEQKSDGIQHQVDQVALHLRSLQAQADRLGIHINNLQGFVDQRTSETKAIHRGLEQRLGDQAGLAQRINAFEERTVADGALIKGELSEFGALLSRLLGNEFGKTADPSGKESASRANQKAVPGMDSFYVAFENRFRGPRNEIKKRVEFYLPFIRKSRAGGRARPILDIGCGRGEWLELLKENKLEGRGVDLNATMVAQCKARGLKVELRDAISYLRSLRANSLGAITGFHIIEHLSFEMLLDLFRQARRALTPGGVAIFESPNCKNLIVGACNFHIDPTHRNPVFPETAEMMLASQGFEKIQIEYLSPVPDVKFSGDTAELAVIKDLLYGPQDFGIIAFKPAAR